MSAVQADTAMTIYIAAWIASAVRCRMSGLREGFRRSG